MSENTSAVSSVRGVLIRYCILTVLYISLIFILPTHSHTMQQNPIITPQNRLLLLTTSLPLLVTWLFGFFGYARLQDYAHTIRRSPEGKSYSQLSHGVTWLAWSFVLPAFMYLIVSNISAQHTGLWFLANLCATYSTITMTLIAFVWISVAARSLNYSANIPFSIRRAKTIMLFFAVAGLAYCYIVVSHFEGISIGSTQNTYGLPLWIILLTVIVPSLYAWFSGLLAASEIIEYSRKISGTVYRQALRLLVSGLLTVITALIGLQYIISASPRLHEPSLDSFDVLIILLELLAAFGFILITLGARQLQRIEEV